MIHQSRRKTLLKQLNDGALVIISTNPQQLRSGDVFYPFRPNSDFWYLTGFTEPQALAVFSSDNYTIFLRDNDPKRQIWDGKHLGVSAATQALKADNAYDIKDLSSILPRLISKAHQLYYDFKPSALDQQLKALLPKTQSFKAILHEMRLIKTSDEIALMQKAADIAVKAHQLAIQKTQAGLFEFEISSLFNAVFTKHNAEHAYPPIVASGKNACVLHYINNNQQLKSGDLLLIDSGCEIQGYATDITRTFPINGKFTPAQRAIYQIVLQAQKAAIACIKPGELVNKPHRIATDIIKQGLMDLGILQAGGDLQQFFMHGTAHWLGLDVHDVGTYKQHKQHKQQANSPYRQFVAGMVTTIEPGIYIRPDDKIDPAYWHIAVRIEDDVVVTETAHHLLTHALVKEIDAIEFQVGSKASE